MRSFSSKVGSEKRRKITRDFSHPLQTLRSPFLSSSNQKFLTKPWLLDTAHLPSSARSPLEVSCERKNRNKWEDSPPTHTHTYSSSQGSCENTPDILGRKTEFLPEFWLSAYHQVPTLSAQGPKRNEKKQETQPPCRSSLPALALPLNLPALLFGVHW